MSVPEYQAQFYISAEGISRDVITTDICRYLGNNAVIRPNMDINVYKPPYISPQEIFSCVSDNDFRVKSSAIGIGHTGH